MSTKNKNLTFGDVIKALKDGQCARRVSWNGKGMHIYLEDMWSFPIKGGIFKGQERKYGAVVVLYTGSSDIHQPGWVCSQADMLAEDWQIVNPK